MRSNKYFADAFRFLKDIWNPDYQLFSEKFSQECAGSLGSFRRFFNFWKSENFQIFLSFQDFFQLFDYSGFSLIFSILLDFLQFSWTFQDFHEFSSIFWSFFLNFPKFSLSLRKFLEILQVSWSWKFSLNFTKFSSSFLQFSSLYLGYP